MISTQLHCIANTAVYLNCQMCHMKILKHHTNSSKGYVYTHTKFPYTTGGTQCNPKPLHMHYHISLLDKNTVLLSRSNIFHKVQNHFNNNNSLRHKIVGLMSPFTLHVLCNIMNRSFHYILRMLYVIATKEDSRFREVLQLCPVNRTNIFCCVSYLGKTQQNKQTI